jgi:hypothetical protein
LSQEKTAGAFPRRWLRFIGCNATGSPRQNRPDRMQHFLKAPVGPARARIVSAELFDQLLVAVNDPDAAFNVRFGREAATALTGALESRAGRDANRVRDAWDTS